MRVLVTGLGTFWGSRLAQRIEALDEVEIVVGLDTRDPRLPLERTEFVRADHSYSILHRIVAATRIDTILHTHLVIDSTTTSGRTLHENNVIGTLNLLAAAGAPKSTVRRLVVKGSTLVYGATNRDPMFFREDMRRMGPARTGVERSLLEIESFVSDFAEDNPDVDVTLLRFANILGDDIETPLIRCLRLPLAPSVWGFDPRLQFVHEHDVVGALMHAVVHPIPGVFNVAGDGAQPWSEVCHVLGKDRFPLPPFFTGLATESARLFGIRIPPETLDLLRYGRMVDNRAFIRAGYRYQLSSAATVDAFAQSERLRGAVGEAEPEYRYQRDVETFFRHSPAVVRDE